MPSLWQRTKQLTKRFFHPGRIGLGSIFLGRDVDIARVVGNGTRSSVFAPIGFWMQRSFMEAVPMVYRKVRGGKLRDLPDHEFLDLLQRPNPFYSMKQLFGGALWDYMTDGNGYWIKVRKQVGTPWYENVVGQVEALYWAPTATISPVGDEYQFLKGYQYQTAGKTVLIAPENIVHFRHGLDPEDPRRGLSPLRSQLNELAADAKASSMMARLLHNMGIPGLLLSPKNQDLGYGGQSAETIKQTVIDKTTGSRMGEPMVFTMPTDLQQFGFEPRRMELGGLRNTAEERVCAVFAINPAVIGYSAGLEQTKVGATMKEVRKLSYHQGVVPVQDDFAAEIERSFDREYLGGLLFYFNRDEVEALAEDRAMMVKTAVEGYKGEVMTLAEAREDIGLDTDPSMEVFYSAPQPLEQIPGQGPALLPPPPKRLNPAHLKHSGTARELAILERAVPGEKTEDQLRFIRRLEKMQRSHEKAFASILAEWFDKEMGATLEDLALEVIPEPVKVGAYLNGGSQRIGLKDVATELYTSEIMQRLDSDRLKRGLQALGETFYLGVAKDVYEALNDYPGLAIELSDAAAEATLRAGGRNLGLVDLTSSTRDKLFEVLAEAQEIGLGPKETARRIREIVPAGPWSSPKVRSEIIARHEVLNAQRQSTLQAYNSMDNVQQVMVFDDRIGFGDDICSALDGTIVSLEDAEALAEDEHVNGTRSFAPYVP
jgi:phage portal protein BeeE